MCYDFPVTGSVHNTTADSIWFKSQPAWYVWRGKCVLVESDEQIEQMPDLPKNSATFNMQILFT